MATVKMKKGGKYADIYDSPETIAQARSEGYEIVTESRTPVTQAEANDDSDDNEKSKAKAPSRTKRQ